MTESIQQAKSKILGPRITNAGIIQRIGNTPLIELNTDLFPEVNSNVKIFAKAEFFNPGGSVKDRPAWNMVKQGILNGELEKGQTIIDASSGNTGIALAMVGSALGFEVTICIPKNASPERLNLLKAYGATIEITDPLEGTDGAIIRARELVKGNPDKFFYTDQYNNQNNWKAHYNTTAEEILQQTNKTITHFVAGLGTSGTFVGITRKLREELDSIKCISMQPDSPLHGLEGLKHMESSMTPGIYEEDLADENIIVSTKRAQQLTKKLAQEEGLLVGISSGANVAASVEVANKLEKGCIVTILCDRGERYLNEQFWE